MYRQTLVRTCICGVLIGLAVVFCRLLGFPQSGMWRIEFSFLPIALVAMFYGPLWAGASYTIADVIGAAIYTGVNPFIALQKCLTGVVMGLFLYQNKRVGFWKLLLCMGIISIFLDFLMMAAIFHFAFGHPWETALVSRLVNGGINLGIRVLVLMLCEKGKVYERLSGILQ